MRYGHSEIDVYLLDFLNEISIDQSDHSTVIEV